LGSGSRGNATLIESAAARILVDCGFGVREMERRLAWADVDPASLDALLITHEHGDHMRGAVQLAGRHGLKLMGSRGTFRGVELRRGIRFEAVNPHAEAIALADIKIHPIPVPHDSREPVQYLFAADGRRFGMMTDTGSITPHALERLRGCDALMLECNHDPEMLRDGPYPWSLKQRVAGQQGHLSNQQAGELLRQLDSSRLSWLAAAHLSEKNNRPELAMQALLAVDEGLQGRIAILEQECSAGWLEV
jgi:phosphoribosyl 1,2-cyclic phosphodiesterase